MQLVTANRSTYRAIGQPPGWEAPGFILKALEWRKAMNDLERKWCSMAMARGGSFVAAFARACVCADESNFKVVQPALAIIMLKYPRYGDDFTDTAI